VAHQLKFMGLMLISMLAFPIAVFAQEDPENTQAESTVRNVEMAVVDGDGLAAPMVFSTVTESTGDGAPTMRINALPAMSFMGTNGTGIVMGSPDPFSLLGDPSVQKDLELVGDQLKQLQELQKDFSAQMKEQIGDLSKGGIGPDRFKGLGELVQKLREQQKTQMQELLLPHQIDRLKQVALQKQMDRSGAAGALTSSEVAEQLGITDEQKERLKKREKEIKEELAKKVVQLREEARQELLQELTAKQREQLKQMTGEKFKAEPNDWREMFQKRQNRPGRLLKSTKRDRD
jgi:hypothetical protein